MLGLLLTFISTYILTLIGSALYGYRRGYSSGLIESRR